MKLKSVLSILLCMLMAFTPVFAQGESDNMQKTLAHAKTVLEIPEDYTEFSYYSQTDTDGTVYWTFCWEGEQKGTMEATFCEDGFLFSYYAWVYTESYDDALAKYTHDEARDIAKAFIERVNPQTVTTLLEETPEGENRNSHTAYFVFREYYGDIPSFSDAITITVDKYHGIVRNYQCINLIDTYTNTTPVLTEEEAKEIYLRDMDIQLEYRTYYNYQDQTYKVFPVYYLKDTSGKAVDAISGEVVEPYIPESYLFGTITNGTMADSAMKEESAEGGVQFTPEELEALAQVSEIHSKESALKIAAEKIPALADYTLRSASLQHDYRDETKLIWYFDLKNETSYANVQLNAKTGQLLGFYLPQNNLENQEFTKEEAKKIAEEFLKTEAADVFDKTAYREDAVSYIPAEKEGTLPSAYYITYQRMENGIPVSRDSLTVRVDSDTKQVGFYSRSFTEGLSFPDISTCMSKEDIFDVMNEKMNFNVTFLPTEDGSRVAYTFLNPTGQPFDAYTGSVLRYDGTPVTESFVPEYTDISGHWAEEMIRTLLDNGYYFSENEFRPDDAITKKEFLTFFGMTGNDTDEQINEVIANIEGISEENADCNKVMRKEELCHYFIYRMGSQKIAGLDEIFNYPFPDDAEVSDSLKGDIAILTGLGVFRGSSDGRFYPAKELTRAEAVSAVYYFLKNAQ